MKQIQITGSHVRKADALVENFSNKEKFNPVFVALKENYKHFDSLNENLEAVFKHKKYDDDLDEDFVLTKTYSISINGGTTDLLERHIKGHVFPSGVYIELTHLFSYDPLKERRKAFKKEQKHDNFLK